MTPLGEGEPSSQEEVRLERVVSSEKEGFPAELQPLTFPHRLLLAAVGTLLLTAVVWSVLGSIPVRVRGKGMILRGGEVIEVTTPLVGTVQDVLVKPGEIVERNQPVVRLSQADIVRQLDLKRADRLQREPEVRVTVASIQAELQAALARRERVAPLVKTGVMTPVDLATIDGAISSARIRIQSQESILSSLDQQIRLLEARLEEDSQIRSTTKGRVMQVSVREGDTVQSGDQLMTLEPTEGELQVTIFVAGKDGKRIQQGQEAQVAPAHIRPEESGYLKARVEEVASAPSTPEAIRKAVRNNQMVEDLLKLGSPFQIRLALETETTPSGQRFRWTSPRSASLSVEGGSPCTAAIIVDRQRPISFVISAFRSR